MIDIGFLNLILIIADNNSGSRKLDIPCLSAPVTPNSSRSFALVRSGSPRFYAPVEFSNPSNFIPDFLTDVLTNPFGDFNVNASSDLAVASVPSFTISFISHLPALGRFSQDDFLALAADAFSALG